MKPDETPRPTDPELRPFAELRLLPAELTVPRWLGVLLALVMAGGAALGLATAGGRPGLVLIRPIFFAAAFGYATVSLVDFWEHARLEKLLTGRYLESQAVPPGETINHVLTTLTIVAILVLARPLPRLLAARDWFVLGAPALFLALAWRDELVYHRRRAARRENLMHTVAHLAAGMMLAAFYVMRLGSW